MNEQNSGSGGGLFFDVSAKNSFRNQPQNNKQQSQDFNYSTPTPERLNSEDSYRQALRFQQFAGDESARQQINAMNNAAANNLDIYRNKTAIDQQNKIFESELSNRGGDVVSSIGKSAFGQWGSPTLARRNFSIDGTALGDNQQQISDYNFQREQATLTARMIKEAEASGDIARDKAQARNQRDNAIMQNNSQINLMNRQASLDAQRSATDAQRQRDSEASKERIAAMQAQGSILGGLFGSIGSGNPNYRYWGG